MSDSSAFGGASLLDLFKMEAETHCAALSDGLLALERSPTDTSPVEAMMRAAHSIKGAARIVGLDVIVPLAHAMEDTFLAAKSSRDPLTPGRVDQLLQCVDVLADIRGIAEADLPAWITSRAEQVTALITALRAPPPSPKSPPTPAPTAPPPAEAPAPVEPRPAPAATPAPTSGAAGTVRLAAGMLTRMLFLAGESTVEASRLQSLRVQLSGLKARERALEHAVQELGDTLAARQSAAGRPDPATREAFESVVSRTGAMQTALVEQSASLDEAFRRVEEISGALYAEVIRSRMRPFSEGTSGFPRMVRDLARELGKDVVFRLEGESVLVDRDILQKVESPLTHLIRNSLDHGVETPTERESAGKPPTAKITLSARHQGGVLVIEVSDDGRGIDPEAVRIKVVERRMVDAETATRLTREELLEMLFLPGFSTKQEVTAISGRGVGLNVVQSMAQEVSGIVTLHSEPDRGARFVLRLPVARSVVRATIVRISGQFYAVPLAKLDRIVVVPEDGVTQVQGRATFTIEGSPVGLVWASDMLETPSKPAGGDLPVLVIGSGADRCGLVVDEVRGEEDLVVRPLDARLGQTPHLSAAAIRSDGSPLLVIDVEDLWRSVKQALGGGRPLGVATATEAAAGPSRRRVLVVDDSITVREVERQLLGRHGYDVEVAVDGKDGFNKLRAGRFDLLLTDVDMPRMTGIELVRAVRAEAKLADLPIIIVSYKDREEDRLAGLNAGANAYLTKSSFQDDSLIRMVQDLIGAPR